MSRHSLLTADHFRSDLYRLRKKLKWFHCGGEEKRNVKNLGACKGTGWSIRLIILFGARICYIDIGILA